MDDNLKMNVVEMEMRETVFLGKQIVRGGCNCKETIA